MAYQILEKESIDITHIDQAVLHNFIANNQSGIIGGYANECSLTSMGNTLIISTGMLLINGVRVKISEVESVVLSSTPTQDTTYQLIAQLTIDSNQAPSFEFIARTPQALIKNPIGQDGGVGVYQLELARFTHATDGTIKNIVRTANVLYGATNIDLNEIRASVQDARSQAQSAKQEAQAVYELASNAVATSAAAQATAQEAKQIAQQAQEDVRGIEINVAEERGTVVTENGQPKAQVEWNDKLDKTPKEPKVVSDAFLTRITATNDIEIIDSPLGVKTATIKSIKGLSIKQVLKNGDFSDGTNGWSANLATLSVSNKVLTVTVNSLDESVGFYGSGQPKSIANHPYYISAYINPKYANNVRIGYGDNYASFSGSGLLVNRWNFVSAIVIPEQSGETFLFYHYAASDYAVGDTFRVADVRCIDLVDSGLTGWTKEQLDAAIPHLPYWEDVRHSNPTQLKSVGDNLIKLEPKTITGSGVTMTVNADCTITFNGTAVASAVFHIIGSLDGNIILKYPVTDLQLIIEHISGEFTGGSLDVFGNGRLVNDGTVLYGDQLQCVIPAGSAGRVYKSVLYRNRAGYLHNIRLYAPSGCAFNEATFRIMLVHKNNPLTEYKPYNENILQLPQKALKKVGNVADVIDMVSQTYTQRIGTYILDDTKSIVYTQSSNNGLSNTVRFIHRFADILTSAQAFILNDLFPNIGDVASDVEHIMNQYYNYYNIHIFIDKQRLVPYGYTDALSDAQKVNCFKAWLVDNPLTIYFLLAEPTTEPLDKEYDATYPAWNYGLEQIFDADGNPTIAQMDIEYPLDLQKQVDTNTWLIQRLMQRLNQLSQE